MTSPARRTFGPQSHQSDPQPNSQRDHSYYQQMAAQQQQQQQQAHYQQQQQQQQQYQYQYQHQQHPNSIPMPMTMQSTSPSHHHPNPPTSSAPPSPSSKSPSKFSWGFGRSRRNSEATSDNEGNSKGNRSRKNSRSPSPNTANPNVNSFVVRSVTKQPGGVNASPNGSDSGSPSHPGMNRRMTLDNQDSQQAGAGAGGAGQYQREKSRPLSTANALGVPLGGPGGGVGYGGKGSSNDGRPEGVADGNRININSIQRPASPGAISKKGFNQGVESKNKIQQASNQLQQQRSRSPSPSPSNSSASRVRPLVGAGPLSVREREARARDYAINGGRVPEEGSWLSRSRSPNESSTSPSGPRPNSRNQDQIQGSRPASQLQSNSRGGGPINQNQNPNSRFSTSPSTAAVNNANAYANYSPSNPPPESALQGLPSPVPIPMSNRDRSNSTSNTPGGTSPRTPFGSVSPGGSPSLANRLIKGIFGARSPKPDDGEIDGQQVYSSQGGGGAGPPGSQWKSPQAWSDGSPLPGRSPLNHHKSGLNPEEDEVEREAQLRKRSSQRQAARIVDEERKRAFETPSPNSNPNGFDPSRDKPWSPRQVIPSNDEEDGGEFPNRSTQGSAAKKGRKPVPNLNEVNHAKLPSEHDLKLMDEDERRKVARDVDPGDALSRLEGRLELTPAQRIIQETRSKHLAEEERQENARRAQLAAKQQQQQRGPTVQRGFEPNGRAGASETSVGRPPTLPDKAREMAGNGKAREMEPNQEQGGSGTSPAKQNSTPQPGPGAQRQSQPGTAPTHPQQQKQQTPANSGLVPGSGPMPTQMPLNAALQEMVVRFYRFERYAVPLIRSLETRLLDIERDAQMAQLQGDALSVNSNRDREMDKWVGQMTSVMKHEVGQLKAATKEIREGRELVAEVARMQNRNRGREPSASMSNFNATTSGFLNQNQPPPLANGLRNNPDLADSPSSTRVETGAPIQAQQLPGQPSSNLQRNPTSKSSSHNQTSQFAGGDEGLTPSNSEQSINDSQAESVVESEGIDSIPATTGHAQRNTNISSASFTSAVPVSSTDALNRERSRSNARDSNSNPDSPSVSALQRKKTLDLPPGSAPVLDKDEGKYSPKKYASREFEHGSSQRERSTSPSGRKRYTSTLGEPMRDGRISPSGESSSQTGSRISNFSREDVLSPPRSNRFDSVGSDPRKGANMSSPSHSETGSVNSTSTAGRRDVSNRLKALMTSTSTSTSPKNSPSLLSGSGGHDRSMDSASSSMIEQEREAQEDEANESVSSRIGDDYAMVSSPLQDERVSKHQSQPSTGTNTTVTQARVAAASNDRLQAPPSPAGHSAASHLKTPSNPARSNSNSSTEVGTATPLIGGRVSPTPSRRSTSPSNFVPIVGGGEITTSSNASQGLRARAQNYLSKAEEPEASTSTSPSATTHPSNVVSGGGGSHISTYSRKSTNVGESDQVPPTSKLSQSPPKLSHLQNRKESTSPLDLSSSANSNSNSNPSSSTQTQALNFKKSENSFKSSVSVNTNTNANTASTISNSPRKGPPPGASLKERVAFFDTQK